MYSLFSKWLKKFFFIFFCSSKLRNLNFSLLQGRVESRLQNRNLIIVVDQNSETPMYLCAQACIDLNNISRKVKVKSLSRVRLFATPRDCSLPGSSVHGIFQSRVLEWVAIPFSRRSSQPRDWTRVSRTVGRRFTIWATREVDLNNISWIPVIYRHKI